LHNPNNSIFGADRRVAVHPINPIDEDGDDEEGVRRSGHEGGELERRVNVNNDE
jgi:hypothetical protein